MKLQDLISWSVWDEFSDSPVTGWMKELNCALPLKDKYEDTKQEEELQ